jgi:alpha-L-fucosidase
VKRLLALLAVLLIPVAVTAQTRYEPTWESLDRRPIPAWFDEAKFGIFIHWGVYSVPAWGPKGKYAEWYWNDMQDRNGATWKHHAATYGETFRYQEFAPRFKAEMFNPDQWADLFARSGARYVVLTSKHHEGFCLWPSAEAWNWNSVDVGPHRDLVGDLAKSVRARGMKYGLYYSLYEWFNPIYRSDPKRYVAERMLPQLKDLVTRYQPSVIFADGEWDHPSELWRSTEFLAWLYNEAPNRDEVVVDDRWGKETRSRHGGYYTTEYGEVGGGTKLAERRKWEECRGMGASFGYNRNEDVADYKTGRELIHLLVDTVSKGGNLLLDIGPTADGRIPVIMQQRLLEIGEWLPAHGEAIYGTRPWRVTAEGEPPAKPVAPARGGATPPVPVRYTTRDGIVYAVALRWPGRELVLSAPKPGRNTTVTLLGHTARLHYRRYGSGMRIAVPIMPAEFTAGRAAYVFKLTNVQ